MPFQSEKRKKGEFLWEPLQNGLERMSSRHSLRHAADLSLFGFEVGLGRDLGEEIGSRLEDARESLADRVDQAA